MQGVRTDAVKRMVSAMQSTGVNPMTVEAHRMQMVHYA